jgi:hypothetical protein
MSLHCRNADIAKGPKPQEHLSVLPASEQVNEHKNYSPRATQESKLPGNHQGSGSAGGRRAGPQFARSPTFD